MDGHTPTWLTDLAAIGYGVIGLGIVSIGLAFVPFRAIGAATNRLIARPVYLLVLLISRRREPERKHGTERKADV